MTSSRWCGSYWRAMRFLFAAWIGTASPIRSFLRRVATTPMKWKPASCNTCGRIGCCLLSEAGSGREHKFKMAALREGWVWTQRDWTQATDDTGIGDPRQATPEKGRRCLEQVASATRRVFGRASCCRPRRSLRITMQFYAFVAPGARGDHPTRNRSALGRPSSRVSQRGVVFFATDAPPQDLLGLGTTEDVFALVARGRVETSREGLGRGRRTRG